MRSDSLGFVQQSLLLVHYFSIWQNVTDLVISWKVFIYGYKYDSEKVTGEELNVKMASNSQQMLGWSNPFHQTHAEFI